MKPSLWLRITSILSLVFAAGHTLGGLKYWSPSGETEVLRAMRSFHFEAEGVSRTYLDFYLGFGYILGVYLFLQAVALWQLAKIAKADPLRVCPLIASFFVTSVVSAFLSWKFIFVVPVVFSLVIAACLGFTFYIAGKGERPPLDTNRQLAG
jgi:hypothetical protein